MSVPRGNGQNGGHYYSNITQPVKIDVSFIVDASNSNGLGIRSLKSNGYVQSVFMHTSATPATGNPNPALGFAVVRFNNNYNVFLNEFACFISPLTGSDLTSVTNHVTYVITALGTATLAQWQAVGYPAGFTPAVGQSFVATATGTIGGSATVKVTSASGVTSVEVEGSPLLSNSSVAANGGAQVILKFLNSTTATNPTDETIVELEFTFDASSVSIDGL